MKKGNRVKDRNTKKIGTISSTWRDDMGLLNVIVNFDFIESDVVYWSKTILTDAKQNFIDELEVIT
jgi:hypothetical protein